MSSRPQLWILIHTHRHGIDVFPVAANDQTELPDPGEVIESNLSSLELDADEDTEWRGPFSMPEVRK